MTRATTAFLSGLVAVAGCASAASRAPVDAPAGRPPSADAAVARDVGRLLSGEPAAAAEAEQALEALDAPGREALARFAARVPGERDRRYLHVLDRHGLLPPLDDATAVDLRLWQAARGDAAALARAQDALTTLARRDPAPLLARLDRGGPGADVLAVALADAGIRAAVPALVARYRSTDVVRDRRIFATAIARLVAPARGPDPAAVGPEVDREAQRVLSTEVPRGTR